MASNTSPQPEPRTASTSATPRTAARIASQPALALSSPRSPCTIAIAGRGQAAPDRDGAARVLPAAAPLMAEGKDLIVPARQRGGRDQVLAAEIAFLAQERQAVVPFGVGQAAGDLPGRDNR